MIPFDCDSFSRQALYGLLAEIEELKDDHNEGLEVEGIVVNQFQARASLPQQILDELIAEGLPVLPVYLASSVRMRESHQESKPLIHLDPRHKLTQQFVALHNLLENACPRALWGPGLPGTADLDLAEAPRPKCGSWLACDDGPTVNT